jgi:hypothetical protein
LKPFLEGLFDPLVDEEKNLLELFRYRDDDYYIIGAQNNSVLRHELAHALYSHNMKYKQAIDSYISQNKKFLTKTSKYILDKGYCKEVLNDELQAYITDNDDEFIISNTPNRILQDINSIHRKFK